MDAARSEGVGQNYLAALHTAAALDDPIARTALTGIKALLAGTEIKVVAEVATGAAAVKYGPRSASASNRRAAARARPSRVSISSRRSRTTASTVLSCSAA